MKEDKTIKFSDLYDSIIIWKTAEHIRLMGEFNPQTNKTVKAVRVMPATDNAYKTTDICKISEKDGFVETVKRLGEKSKKRGYTLNETSIYDFFRSFNGEYPAFLFLTNKQILSVLPCLKDGMYFIKNVSNADELF